MTDTTNEKRTTEDPPPSPVPWKWQYIFASVLLGLFVILVAVMLLDAKSSDSTWKNLVYVFSSAEALVFTAVGWVFGREVQRTQVQAAQSAAEDAKKEAAHSRNESEHAQHKASEEEKKVAALHAAIDVATAQPVTGQARAADIAMGGPPAAAVVPGLAALGRLVEQQRRES